MKILWTVLVIFIVALAVRLVFVTLAVNDWVRFPDERQYLNIAENFIGGNGLIVSIDSRTQERLIVPLEVARPPAYPLFLALSRRLGLQIPGIRILQALIGALTCVSVYFLGRELMGEMPGRIAGGIAAVYPFFVFFTGLILSETLFLLLFISAWCFLVRMWKQLNDGAPMTHWLATAMIAGFLSAVAVLTRAEALAVFLLMPFLMLLMGPRRLKGFAGGLVVLLVVAALMVPWVGRNYWVTRKKDQAGPEGKIVQPGRLVITTLKVGESLYEAVGPNATGGPNKENTLWPEETFRLFDNEYERNRFLLERSLSYMRGDPVRMVRLAGQKFLRTWSIVPNFEGAQTWGYRVISMASYIPVMVLALIGLAAATRRPRAALWLMLPVAVITLMHMVFVGSVRYRLVMMPFIIIFAGVGAWWVVSRFFRHRRWDDEARTEE